MYCAGESSCCVDVTHWYVCAGKSGCCFHVTHWYVCVGKSGCCFHVTHWYVRAGESSCALVVQPRNRCTNITMRYTVYEIMLLMMDW